MICSHCGAEVILVTTDHGKTIQLDREPFSGRAWGGCYITRLTSITQDGKPRLEAVSADRWRDAGEPRYQLHRLTCTGGQA